MQAAVIEHSFRLQPELIKSDKFGQTYQFSDKGDKKPEDNDASKVPPGFEKFFKRKTPSEQPQTKPTEEKKEQQAAQKLEEEEKSDNEEAVDSKEQKKSDKDSKPTPSHLDMLKESFWRPDGKGPNPWGWFLLGVAVLAIYNGLMTKAQS